jgi:hypothetical protein
MAKFKPKCSPPGKTAFPTVAHPQDDPSPGWVQQPLDLSFLQKCRSFIGIFHILSDDALENADAVNKGCRR